MFTVPQAQLIAGEVGKFDYISIAGKPGVSQDQVAASVHTALTQAGYGKLDVVTGEKLISENQSQIGKALGFLNTGLLIFGLVALVVGAFIIYNTFSIVVAQRTREMAFTSDAAVVRKRGRAGFAGSASGARAGWSR